MISPEKVNTTVTLVVERLCVALDPSNSNRMASVHTLHALRRAMEGLGYPQYDVDGESFDQAVALVEALRPFIEYAWESA